MNNQRDAYSQSAGPLTARRGLVPVKTTSTIFKRKKWIALLVGVVSLLIVSLLITNFILLTLYLKRNSYSENMLCDDEDCIKIAASLKESMNETVDPCDDFYKYACGRWTNQHPIPDMKFTHTWFDEGDLRVTRTIRNLLQKNLTNVDHIPRAVLQAQTFYDSCMNIEVLDSLGLNPLFSLLDKLHLPHIPAALTHEKTFNFIQQMARLKRILAVEVFIGIDVFPDPKNNTKNIVMIGIPEWDNKFPGQKKMERKLPKLRNPVNADDNTLQDDETEDDDNLIEITYISNVIKEVVSNGTAEDRGCKTSNSSFPYEEEIFIIADNIYKTLAQVHKNIQDVNNGSSFDIDLRDDDYMNVDDLQQITDEYVTAVNSTLQPRVIWKPFIEELFHDIFKTSWDNKEKILVLDLEYLQDMAVFFAATEDELLETIIWWTVIETVVPYSSQNLRKTWASHLEETVGIEMVQSRSIKCTEVVNYLMGMAVTWLFVEPAFHDDDGPRVIEMLNNIRSAFTILVHEADWMDELTKIATLRKNLKMKFAIGYPEWLFNEGQLDKYYENIILSTNEYLINTVNLTQNLVRMELENLQKDNDVDEAYWTIEPTDVNAFHTFYSNQITIPAGILQFPFYNLGLEALNYGAIGTILGHELTHGFDNNGRLYDSEGNYRQWWTNNTISEYIERSHCFVDQYSGYYIAEVNEFINGELTLGENIADNVGLKEAFIAYKIWQDEHDPEPHLSGFTNLTHEQLFFLGFAHTWCETYTKTALDWLLKDTHCPGYIRLSGVLKNSKEFSQVWQCPVGSNMNPVKKCHLW